MKKVILFGLLFFFFSTLSAQKKEEVKFVIKIDSLADDQSFLEVKKIKNTEFSQFLTTTVLGKVFDDNNTRGTVTVVLEWRTDSSKFAKQDSAKIKKFLSDKAEKIEKERERFYKINNLGKPNTTPKSPPPSFFIVPQEPEPVSVPIRKKKKGAIEKYYNNKKNTMQ